MWKALGQCQKDPNAARDYIRRCTQKLFQVKGHQIASKKSKVPKRLQLSKNLKNAPKRSLYKAKWEEWAEWTQCAASCHTFNQKPVI